MDSLKRNWPRHLHITYTQTAASHNAVLTQDAFPPLLGKTHQGPTNATTRRWSTPMGTSHQEPPQQEETERKQVSYPHTNSSISPKFQIPIHSTMHSAHPDLLKELRAIRTEITLLCQGNAALKHENAPYTTATIEGPAPQGEPTGAAAHESSLPPPPTKRESIMRLLLYLPHISRVAQPLQKTPANKLWSNRSGNTFNSTKLS